MAAAVGSGRFRADLYHRLAVVILAVPPLRERQEDVGVLVRHFLQRYASAHGLRAKQLSPAAEAWLQGYSWPGNVRELSHVMQRVTLLCPEDMIEPSILEQWSLQGVNSATLAPAEPDNANQELSDEALRIQEALRRTGGNVTRAARLLGLSRKALRYRLGRSGITLSRLDEGTVCPAARRSPAPPRHPQSPESGACEEAPTSASAWEQRTVAVLAPSTSPFPWLWGKRPHPLNHGR